MRATWSAETDVAIVKLDMMYILVQVNRIIRDVSFSFSKLPICLQLNCVYSGDMFMYQKWPVDALSLTKI
jgi:hypothetical protein